MKALTLIALILAGPPLATGSLEDPRIHMKKFLLAEACTPTMSCFGKVTVLPNGELVEKAAAATDAVMLIPTDDTPKKVEASKVKPDSTGTKAQAKPKAEVKTQPVARKLKPCIPKGGTAGPGRFKPYRGPGVWILCEYKCGQETFEREINPGIEADCWTNLPTYME